MEMTDRAKIIVSEEYSNQNLLRAKRGLRGDESDVDSVLNRIRKSVIFHFVHKLFTEDTELVMTGGSSAGKSVMKIGNIFGGGRDTEGYKRIETEDEPGTGGRIVLDPLGPLKWATKKQFVQNPTRYDALASLCRDSEEEESFEKKFTSTQKKEMRLNSSVPPNMNGDKGAFRPLEGRNNSMDNIKEDPSTKFIGIFLAAVSGLFFTLCSVTVKLLSRIDPSEVLVFRAVIQLVLTVPIVICSGNSLLGPKGVRILVYLQGVIGCLTVTCIFIGFARLPVGDAATIIFCSPIFVMIFSHILLREHCGLFRVVVISMLLMGVILIAKPPFLNKLLFSNQNNALGQDQGNDYDLIGYGAAFGGTILTASNFVCMRKLKEVHFSVLIFAFSIMSGTLSSCVVPLVAEFTLPETLEEWVYAILVGIFGLLGQCLLALALRYETAGVVSVTRSMDIAVAYVIQIVWFGDIPLWTSILGAFIVILAVFTMAMESAFLHLLEMTFGDYGWC